MNLRGLCKKRKGCSSIYRGVSFIKARKKWLASAQIDGKSFYLGYHELEVDAARSYDKFALKNGWQLEALNFSEKHCAT